MLSSDIVESEDSAAADEVVREIVTGQPFSPREETGREGVLIVGQPSKRRREATLCRPPMCGGGRRAGPAP